MSTDPEAPTYGGYFPLEPGDAASWPRLEQCVGFESARAALTAWLRAKTPSAVWVPWYVCDVVGAALSAASVAARGYALAPDGGPPEHLPLRAQDVLLVVDYGGLNAAACARAVELYGATRVVVDASQSLFHHPAAGVAVVYSPRKFVGVPDGGLLHTPVPVTAEAADEAGSLARCEHLLLRLGGRREAGRARFAAAEESLQARPRGLSMLTRALLQRIDFERVAARRRANYDALAAALRDRGWAVAERPVDAVPLCCPVAVETAAPLRRALAARGVFCPDYWPGLELPTQDVEGRRRHEGTLYLPCDQRYDAADMAAIAGRIPAQGA